MWEVITTDVFDEWFLAQPAALRESVYESMGVLEKFGPNLGRPHVDTLYGSAFPNMKELRIQHAGNPIRAFLPLTLRAVQSCCALVTKQAQKKKPFTKR